MRESPLVIDPRLDGRVALVTGANQGIGAAIARGLAACGARVLCAHLPLPVDRLPGGPHQTEYVEARGRTADGVVDAITAAGGTAHAAAADLTDATSPRRLFETAESTFGPVEILVNNASSWLPDTFLADDHDRFGRQLHRVDAASHDRQFAVDARAGALMIAEFARRHLGGDGDWGRIIGLSSGGPDGFPGEVSYGAAKAALENYTMSAAQELGAHGVTANIVHPPITDTGWVNDAVRETARTLGPIGHVAGPEDVAEVVTYLASHQARYVTGQIIRMS
jgi:3-oxoacyl-[acyl-carrier protein] reductase